MAKEAKGEILQRRRNTATVVQRHFGSEASAGHRAAALGAVGVSVGAGATAIALAASAAGPELSTVMHAADPGLIGLAGAAGVSAFANGLAYTFHRDTVHAAESYAKLSFMGDYAEREARKAASQRVTGVTVNSWIGRIGIACGVAMGTMAAGFDVTNVAHGQAITGMAGAAEVAGAAGVVALASARAWRRAQTNHGDVTR